MLRILTRLCLLLFSLIPAAVALPDRAVQYVYDGENSQVQFALKHFGIVTVSGHFNAFSGVFRFDPRHIEESRVMLAIQTASVDSGHAGSDRRLRSRKFFWTDQYPEIQFVSTQCKDIQGKRFNIYGDLTIRGRTHPVIFQTELLMEPGDITARETIFFRAQTYIKRKDFHLGTGSGFDPLMFLTTETLKLRLEVEGIPVVTDSG